MKIIRSLILVFIVSAVPSFVLSQKPQTPVHPNSTMMPMPIIAPLFVEDGEFTSTLVLVNPSALNTYADVSIRGLDGKEITPNRVEFPPGTLQRLDIAKLLQSAGSGATSGSILVMQSADMHGMVIAAALEINYLTYPPNYIDEELAMPSDEGSQTLRAVADKADGSPIVAISSLSDSLQHVQIRCLGPAEGVFSKSVDLLAGETILTEACQSQTSHGKDLETILGELKEGGAHQPFGIELQSDAMPGSFAAFALARHKLADQSFFSSVPFSDPKLIMSPNTVFTGVPVGSSPLLPEGDYAPEISIANFGTSPARLTVSYSNTSAGAATTREVAKAIIPARHVQSLALNNLGTAPELTNGFIVSSNSAPGDLVIKAVSKSKSQLHEVELLGTDEADANNGGEHPWSLEGGVTSTFIIFNNTAQSRQFRMQISGEGETWHRNYKLKAMETKALNIADLIGNQVKDDDGKTLNQSILNGVVSWATAKAGTMEARLLQTNPGLALARSFSCKQTYLPCDYNSNVVVSPSSIAVGGSAVANATLSFCVAATPCDAGAYYTDNLYGPVNWSTVPTGIATVSGIGYSASLTGNAAGSTSVLASVTVNANGQVCSTGASAGLTVQVPTYFFSPSATTVSQPAACTQEGNTGLFIDVSYYVADGNSTRIGQSGMDPGENISDGTGWHDAFATPTTTRSDGSFDDTPVGTCYSTSQHYCEAGHPQSFRLTNYGTIYPISTNTTSKECTDGIQLVIQGNPATQNKTYTVGNIQ